MASTLDRFLLRFPSELGCAPGKKLTAEVAEDEAASEVARMREVCASLGGFGVP
jgi:hypothetical protein